MYAGLSSAFLPALRQPHQAYGFVEAWRAGVRLSWAGSTRLPLVDGTVTVDGATPGVRRTLSVSLAPMPGLFDFLKPNGTELRAFTVLRYLSGHEEIVPQGAFDIDAQQVGYGVSGNLQITAPDRWVRVQRARFLTARQFGGGTARALIASLLNEAMPAGITTSDRGTSTATVPSQTEDRDRAGFIQKLATAASLDVYMDRLGNPVIRDAPKLDLANSVWTIDASATGVLIDASRQRNRQHTYNLVVVHASTNNGSTPFATQYVWNNDPKSATYAGPGVGYGATPPAATSAGPFGQQPTFYSSPLVTSTTQAVAAGQTILGKVSGLAAQLSLSNISNPALDDGDTITVQLPRERWDLPRPVEYHIIDKLTVPLVPSKTAMSIDTRSTQADYSESET